MLQWFLDRLTGEGGPLRVRSILAFTVSGVFAYLAVTGDVPAEDIKEVALLIMAFYFITRAAQAAKGE